MQSFILFWTFFIFISPVSSCVWIYELASLVGVPVDITSSAVALKICALTAGN